jgi:hypothetical protein
MVTLEQCFAIAGLASDEAFLGVTPCVRHRMLLDTYLTNMWRGPEVVRDMIIGDLRRFADLGAKLRAADLLIVLRQFLSEHFGARSAQADEAPDYENLSDDSDCLSPQRAGAGSLDRTCVVVSLAGRLRSVAFRPKETCAWSRAEGSWADWAEGSWTEISG